MRNPAGNVNTLVLALLMASVVVLPVDAVVPHDVFTRVPEAADYLLVYELDIPTTSGNFNTISIPYSVDNSSSIDGPFDRIAYYLEVEDSADGNRWVYVSMDAFTDHPAKTGVPNVASGAYFQRPIFNMNVDSNVAGIVTGTGINTGVIEFWPSNYNAPNSTFVPNADEAAYDFGDGGASADAGYGSMQVHNYDLDGEGPGTAGQTLLAYNRWGQSGPGDLGIGNQPGGNPDWTFASNTRSYTVRKLQVLVRPSPVRFSVTPQPRQLYARDRATNKAMAPVVGEVVEPGFDQAVVKVYRAGAVVQTLTQPLVYDSGVAGFSFALEITAELINHDVEFSLVDDEIERYVYRAHEVVAGDIYLINGQSNAVAAQYSGDANVNRSDFLRTFGSSSVDPTGAATVADRTWYIANGNTSNIAGAIGQWGERFGRRVVDATGLPIAILNGAHGGQPINFFQRNDAIPGDLTTNYGRLLDRAQAAGVADHVRAILWHQGESDGSNASGHESGFTVLHDDWLVDYPSTERTYNHQVREGCGSPSIELRDVQRRFQDTLANVTAVSTTGLDGHDGCHYAYAQGYELIGDHLADIVLRDLYGLGNMANIDPPNVDAAYWGNANKTEAVVIMRSTRDGLTWEAGAEDDFHLEGSTVSVTGAGVSGNSLRLALSGDGSTATGVTYDGHSGAGPWVTNLRGVGLLEFYNVPITPAPAAAPTQVGVSADAAGLALSWEPTTPNCFYEVHRYAGPYFDPVPATLLGPALPSGSSSYLDAESALGDPELNHFYMLQAINCDSTSSAGSNRVGEFDFVLQHGATHLAHDEGFGHRRN